MNKKRFAGIDIGSNTILMMIADIDVNSKSFEIIADFHSIARLGEGVDKSNEINPQAIERATKILLDYKKQCNEIGVAAIYSVGTSALRDAKNANEVRIGFEEILQSEIQIISGGIEAKISFLGTVEDTSKSCVIDIGGGSTEIIVGKSNVIESSKSLQMGAVRITERFFPQHPPTPSQIDEARNFIRHQFSMIEKSSGIEKVYSVAGTPTTLTAVLLKLQEYNAEKVHLFNLRLTDLDNIFYKFLSLSVEEITNKLFVPAKRADVITAGTLILSEFLKYFHFKECIVSAYGLRLGILKYFPFNQDL